MTQVEADAVIAAVNAAVLARETQCKNNHTNINYGDVATIVTARTNALVDE